MRVRAGGRRGSMVDIIIRAGQIFTFILIGLVVAIPVAMSIYGILRWGIEPDPLKLLRLQCTY